MKRHIVYDASAVSKVLVAAIAFISWIEPKSNEVSSTSPITFQEGVNNVKKLQVFAVNPTFLIILFFADILFSFEFAFYCFLYSYFS